MRVERIKLHLCAGRNGAAVEDALTINKVHRDGSAGIDDNYCLLHRCIGGGSCQEPVLPRCCVFIDAAADGHFKIAPQSPDVGMKFSGKLGLNGGSDRVIHAGDDNLAVAVGLQLVAPLLHRRGDDRTDIAVDDVLNDMEVVTVEVTDRGARVTDADGKEERHSWEV